MVIFLWWFLQSQYFLLKFNNSKREIEPKNVRYQLRNSFVKKSFKWWKRSGEKKFCRKFFPKNQDKIRKKNFQFFFLITFSRKGSDRMKLSDGIAQNSDKVGQNRHFGKPCSKRFVKFEHGRLCLRSTNSLSRKTIISSIDVLANSGDYQKE